MLQVLHQSPDLCSHSMFIWHLELLSGQNREAQAHRAEQAPQGCPGGSRIQNRMSQAQLMEEAFLAAAVGAAPCAALATTATI